MSEPGVQPGVQPTEAAPAAAPAAVADESDGGGWCCGCWTAAKVEDQEPISVAPGENYILKHSRCITDPHMLILFVAFWGLMCMVMAHSFEKGNVDLILYGYDWKVPRLLMIRIDFFR